MKTNPTDILELISRGNADPLTPAELAALDRAIAADPGLARERAVYTRLDALLARFAMLPDDVDWESLSGDITAEIRAEAAATDDGATAIVAQLSRPLPAVDWDAFRARVSGAIRDEAAQADAERTIKWPAIFSWVAPLAAAALIALVVWGPLGPPNGGNDGNTTPIGNEPVAMVEVELATPTSSGIVAVSFDESPPADAAPETPEVIPGGTVIVNGSWPTSETKIETPTVIDVDTYYY